MNWSPAIQALAAGLGAALPVAAAMAWVIRKVFSLGEWKETLATKEHVAAMLHALQKANDKAHAGITKRLDETCAEVGELKSTVAVLASSVEATRTDVGRILDHLLDAKET